MGGETAGPADRLVQAASGHSGELTRLAAIDPAATSAAQNSTPHNGRPDHYIGWPLKPWGEIRALPSKAASELPMPGRNLRRGIVEGGVLHSQADGCKVRQL